MIYLITGNPGAGKSLYAISVLVQTLMSEKVVIDGAAFERRLVVDGVPNLLLNHELLAPGQAREGVLCPADGDGLWNWPEWCKPGDIIFIDEVQRWWRPRGNGTKVPLEVQALETHRHKGVDFVIVTQNPMLLDQNVRRLVGRHQHVRRLAGMKRAVIYDWDTCSGTLNFKSAVAKSYFGYPKSAYALYKSSELHTKQRQKIPLWVGVPLLGLVLGAVMAPRAFAVLSGAASGRGITQHASAAPSPFSVASAPVPGVVPASGVVVSQSKPEEYSGCIVVRERCACYDVKGNKVDKDPALCRDGAAVHSDAPATFSNSPISPQVMASIDALALRGLARY